MAATAAAIFGATSQVAASAPVDGSPAIPSPKTQASPALETVGRSAESAVVDAGRAATSTPRPDDGLPDLSPVADSDGAAAQAERVVSDTVAVAPEVERNVSDAVAVAPEVERVVSNTVAVAPRAERVVSNTGGVATQVERVVSDTVAVAPEVERVVSDAAGATAAPPRVVSDVAGVVSDPFGLADDLPVGDLDPPTATTDEVVSGHRGETFEPAVIQAEQPMSPPAAFGGTAIGHPPARALGPLSEPSRGAASSGSPSSRPATVKLTPSLSVWPLPAWIGSRSYEGLDTAADGRRASAPADPTRRPVPVAGGASATGSSSVPAAVGGLVLALLLLAPMFLRILKEAPAFLRPAPFLALLERPG